MDTIAIAHDSSTPETKYPRQQLSRCVGCGRVMRDCDCRGCNCATCATKQELEQAEFECGGCHHKKKDCTCTSSHSDSGITTGTSAAKSPTTQINDTP